MACAGCSNQEKELPGPENPGPGAADSISWDGTPSTPECTTDTECEGKVTPGNCELAACVDGVCAAGPGFAGMLCDNADAGICQSGVCEAAADGKLECALGPAPDGYPCGEAFPACGAAPSCVSGLCVDPCDDGNVCTKDTCTADGCKFTPADGGACDDGDPCTEPDTCSEGECSGEKVCDCTVDEDCAPLNDDNPCNGTLECASGECKVDKATIIKCVETGHEPCTQNVCQPETGLCEPYVAEDGFECDDGNECTEGEVCQAGECTDIEKVICEWVCDDENDEDADDKTDCEDADCFGIGECVTPECGDTVCQEFADETCGSCPDDCGECPPECGDGIPQPEIGEECDDGAQVAGDGCDAECKVEPYVPPEGAHLVITEIMKNPDAAADPTGEWFEIQNTSKIPLDLNAFTITDSGTDKHRIYKAGGLMIGDGAVLVLAANGDEAENGGVKADYVYADFALANGNDEIILMAGDTLVDKVEYKELGFPNPKGKTLSLDPASFDPDANDLGTAWCDGETAYGAGDLGTPGLTNPACPACGDDTCDPDETCTSCPDDCGCVDPDVCFLDDCCTPGCAGKDCGDNGCGSVCGTCVLPKTCNAQGKCECVPACAGKDCGDNGCGSVCGTCVLPKTCNAQGKCVP